MKELLKELIAHNVHLSTDKDELVVDFQGELPEELISKIRENKANLISYLNRYTGQKGYSEIPTIEKSESYQVSSGQSRLWLLSQLEGELSAYNIPAVFQLERSIDLEAFKKAVNATIERHESLRTLFKEDNEGNVRQWVISPEELDFKINVKDFSESSDAKSETEQFISADRDKSFDLANGPLFRACLIRTGAEQNVLYLNIHHIISDGWSLGVLSKDIMTFYEGFANSLNPKVEPLRIQYKDYASWQNQQLMTDDFIEKRAFWLQSLEGKLPLLSLSGSKQRPSVMTNRGKKFGTYLNADLTTLLKKYSEDYGGSLFMTLMAGWKVLMYHYSNQKDTIIGTPVAGRSHANLEDQIGFYVNTLALRSQVNPDESFCTFYDRLKTNTLESYEHQTYPFDRLLEDLDVERDISRNPIFDVFLMLLNNASNTGTNVSEVEADKIIDLGPITTKFDLDISFHEVGDCLSFELMYNTDIYSDDIAIGLMSHFKSLLVELLENDDQIIGSVDYLSDQEKHQLLHGFNQTEADYPKEKAIHELFELQASRTPDRIAIASENREFSYQYVNSKANKLANYLLKEVRVDQGEIVGVRLNRTVDYIIAILGILKSGAACAPINPDLPPKRFEKIAHYFKEIIDVSFLEKFEETNDLKDENPKIPTTSSDLAYVLFTSGSTGQQKPCLIEHRGVVNHVSQKIKELNIDENSDVVHASKLHFVGGIWQLWTPLFTGAKVVLPGLEEIQDITALLKLAQENEVKLLEVIPSQIANLLAMDASMSLSELDRLILTGEPLKKRIVDEVFKRNPNLELINTYGITETSDVISSYSMKSGEEYDHRSVGKPIQNVQIYVLNENQSLCPIGVDGEICISGDGLTRGYLNQENLTEERFITHPFNTNQRLYRTGDLGRWSQNGELLFLGRIDHQVHIRGFRIELGEIEQAILDFARMREAVVIAIENDQDETQLAAYFTAEEEKESNELRSYLSDHLPHYMIPDYFVQLEELPLTKNGKLDRKSLPSADSLEGSDNRSYAAPENDLEKQLVELWQSVLSKNRIGVTDDFFVLGGHSLKAVRLINLYERELEVRLSLSELFQNKTIRQHCQLVERAKRINVQQIVPLTTEEVAHGNLHGFQVSDAQRRLWILSQFPEGSVAYNSTGKVFLTERVDQVLLQKALKATVSRHEILRTSFKQNDQGELRQWVEQSGNHEVEIIVTDFSKEEDKVTRMEKFLEEEALVPFDLKTATLYKVGLIKLAEEEYVFYYTLHHIVSDGWSMEVLSDDVFSLYSKWKTNPELLGDVSDLNELKIQYKDYAAWQLKQAESEHAESHKRYWLNQLGGELPLIDLPANKQRPKVKTFSGRTLGGFIGEETATKLKKYTTASDGTIFMGLLSAWNVLVHRYTGENDIIVGSPIAGREQLELENQIGCYINTLAIRNRLHSDQCFNEVFSSIKEHTLNAFTHQSYSFDRLVEDLKLKTDRSRNAVFDISMTYHNQGESSDEHSIEAERIVQITDLGPAPSKNDVELHLEEVGNVLAFNVKFNTDVYEREMIVRLMQHFQLILDELLENPSEKIAHIDFLPSTEKVCLIEEFNQTSADFPTDKTLIDLFVEQVEKSPGHVALAFAEKAFTYQELDEYSSQLAATLVENFESGKNDIIGIQLERSDEMVLAILAVLKTGAAYLPIDPAYPSSRKEYMMQDSGATALITHTSFMFDSDFFDGDVFAIDVEFEANSDRKTDLTFKPTIDDTAYVIYTSGSTGKPKGVAVPHQSIVNTILSQVSSFEVNETTKGLQFASYSFDASVWETFTMLLGGGTLEMIADSDRKDPSLVAEFIQKRGVNWVTLPPSFLNRMDLDSLNGVEKLITAGESAMTEVATAFSAIGTYYNAYGPTETSICATVFEVDGQNVPNYTTLPIGKPIANTEVYILSPSEMLQPIGVVGEICVSGNGLASGYLNQQELTERKFVSHPFKPEKRLYKTGDLGKWTNDGNIIFVGRTDDQVKIRGHRVEPDEIANTLLKH
ncbi:MAG: amino acid adenylation domain-containing protein, partial [Crocinitomicaceae bacterium]